MRTDFKRLYQLASDDRRELVTGICLAIGALLGRECSGSAMAVLLCAEKAFPSEQAEWNIVRAKLGMGDKP